MAETPTPLRRLADPLKWQVLPSRDSDRQRRKRAMPPPAPRAPKRVMKEEHFQEALGGIIERDYFPDVPRLRNQLEWMDAVDSGDVSKMRKVYSRVRTPNSARPATGSRMSVNEGGSGGGGGGGGGGATPLPTPLRGLEEDGPVATGGDGDSVTSVRGENVGGSTTELSMGQFLATHTTEDNESFKVLLHDLQQKKRRENWWMYEKEEQEAARKLLTSGEKAAQGMLRLSDVAEGKGSTEVEGPWRFRTRNQLMWQPDLAISNEISKVKNPKPSMSLLLTRTGEKDKKDAAKTTEQLLLMNQRDDTASSVLAAARVSANHPDKGVVKKATRLDPEFLRQQEQGGGFGVSGGGGSHGGGSHGDGSSGGETPKVAGYSFMATPSPMPGVGGESPLMTWGNIEGTPLILERGDGSTPLDFSNPSPYRVPDPPAREIIAQKLEKKVRDRRRRESSARGSTPNPRHGRGSTTPLQRLSTMSPAAQRLAKRVGSALGGATPLGGSLAGSYSSRARKGARTPASAASTPKTRARRPSVTPVRGPALTDGLL